MKPPKGSLVVAGGSKLAATRENTTPDVEALKARAQGTEIVRLNLRITKSLQSKLKKLTIDLSTTPEKFVVDLIEKALREHA